MAQHFMSQHVEVVGAYGRTYSSIKRALADWNNDLDFRLTTGPYVGKNEADKYNLGVIVRFGPGNERVGTLRKVTR